MRIHATAIKATLIALFCALFTFNSAKAEVKDSITAQVLNVSDSYGDIPVYTSTLSGATYSGQGRTDGNSIIIRSKDKSSGIFANAPARMRLASVTIYFASSNSRRTVYFASMNDTIRTPSDLYNTKTYSFSVKEGASSYNISRKSTLSMRGFGFWADGVVYIDAIVFTWKEVPETSFDRNTVHVAYIGQKSHVFPVKQPGGLQVEFSSSNPEIATVDTVSGLITPKAVGSTVIGAKTLENETYMHTDSIKYILLVEKPVVGDIIFHETFDSCRGKAGWSYWAANGELKCDNEGWTIPDKHEGNGGDACARFGSTSIRGSVTTPAFTRLDGDATFTFWAGAWDTNPENTTLTLSILNGGTFDNGKTTTQIEMNKGQFDFHSLAIKGGTSATRIKFEGAEIPDKSDKKSRFFLDEIKLIVAAPATADLPETTAEGFGTYYAEQAFVMPDGLYGSTVTNAYSDGTLDFPWQYNPGDIVPAHTALLVKGLPSHTYTVKLKIDNQELPKEGNMLHGANEVDDQGYTYVAGAPMKYYILSHHKTSKKLGFYFAAADGGPIKYKSHYAYLVVPRTEAAVSFSLDIFPTSITGVQATESVQGPIYTLTGRRVNLSLSELPAGIYIVNGQKYLAK